MKYNEELGYHCMNCDLVYDNKMDVWMDKDLFREIYEEKFMTSGLCKSNFCKLELAMKMSGIMDADGGLPKNNEELLDGILIDVGL